MSEITETVYRFTGRAVGVDPEGYYFPRWDLAEKVSVLAATKAEAHQKVRAMLGTHSRFGSWRTPNSGWGVIWDSISEETTHALTLRDEIRNDH